MSKKLVSMLLLALVFCLTLTVPAMAATGINTEEQKLLDKFAEKYTIGEKQYGISDDDLAKASAYLMQDGVDLSADQVAKMCEKADELKKLFVDNNIKSFAELKDSNVGGDVLKIVQEAAAFANCTVAYDAATGEITIQDASNQEIYKNEGAIKQTGMNLNATALVVAFVMVAFAACAVVAKKKLFA